MSDFPVSIVNGDAGHLSHHELLATLFDLQFTQGALASRPAAGVARRTFFATDTLQWFRDDGAAWHEVVTAERAPISDPAVWVDVRAKGAVGDFSNDDTVSFQNAAAAVVPGGTVFVAIPTVAWLVSGSLGVSIANLPNVVFKGAGWGSLIKRSGDAALATRRIFTIENCDGLEMRDLAIDLNGSYQFGGISINNSDRCRIDNCRVFDSNLNASWSTYDHYSFVYQNGVDFWLTNCQTEDCELLEADNVRRVHVLYNKAYRSAGTTTVGGFSVSDGYYFEDFEVAFNQIINPRKVGLDFQNEAAGTHNALFRRISLINNQFLYDDAAVASTGSAAIAVGNFTGVASSGNVFDQIIIEGNTIWIDSSITHTGQLIRTNHNQAALWLANSSISNNRITAKVTAGNYAMNVTGMTEGRVCDNALRITTGHGYNLGNSRGTLYVDNFYDGTGIGYSISLNGDHNRLRGNDWGNTTPSAYMTLTNANATNHMDGCGPTRTLTDLSATPSVGGGASFLASSTGAVSITQFADGCEGQVIRIVFTNGNTTVNDNVNIKLAGGNFTGTADDSLTLMKASLVWVEIARSVN